MDDLHCGFPQIVRVKALVYALQKNLCSKQHKV